VAHDGVPPTALGGRIVTTVPQRIAAAQTSFEDLRHGSDFMRMARCLSGVGRQPGNCDPICRAGRRLPRGKYPEICGRAGDAVQSRGLSPASQRSTRAAIDVASGTVPFVRARLWEDDRAHLPKNEPCGKTTPQLLHAATQRLNSVARIRRLPRHPPAWYRRAHHKHWPKRSAPRV